MSKDEKKNTNEKPVSLAPLSLTEALSGLLKVKPKEKSKRKSKAKRRKKTK